MSFRLSRGITSAGFFREFKRKKTLQMWAASVKFTLQLCCVFFLVSATVWFTTVFVRL